MLLGSDASPTGAGNLYTSQMLHRSYASVTSVDRRWLLGGLVVTGGVGLIKLLNYRPTVGPGSRLMLIGDSMAQGLAPQIKALATDERVPWIGRGVPGSRTDQWAGSPWLDRYLVEFRPTLVLVALGTNDAYSNQGDRELAAMRQVAAAIRSAGADLIRIGPPALPAKQLGAALDRHYLDALAVEAPHYFASDELELPRGPDGLHPTTLGFAGWAGRIWAWIT